MAERVQIILEAQDEASGVLRGILSNFGKFGEIASGVSDVLSKGKSVMDLYNRGLTDTSVSVKDVAAAQREAQIAATRLAETIGTMLVQYLKDSYNAFRDYASEVRDFALVSGQSADEASRFIQVLDDFELTADDATKAAMRMKEQGLAPNIDTLVSLSKEFQAIQNPAERMEFIQQNLGKSGAKWVNVLSQTESSLRSLNSSISDHLVLTEQDIRLAEVQRLAVDNVQDTFEGYRIELGKNIGNIAAYVLAENEARKALEEKGVRVTYAVTQTQEYKDALYDAMAAQLQSADASIQYSESLKEQEEALRAVAAANAEFIDLVGTMQGNIESFAEQYQAVNDDINLSNEERAAKLAEIAAQEEEANRRVILSMLEKQLSIDGLDARETEYLLKKGEEWGIYSAEAVAAAQAAMAEVQALSDSIAAIPKQNTITFDIITNGAPPNLAPTATAAPVGTHKQAHADGGMFQIPSGYGNEGFRLGNGDTASSGEMVRITPRGQDPNAGLIAAIEGSRVDERKLARYIVAAMARAG